MPVLSWKGAATQGHAEIGDLALRHLDAAYNLGRWLLGNEHDAADAVHDAFLRATASAGSRADGNPRAWWLAIVRNCCLARLATHGKEHRNVALDLPRDIEQVARVESDIERIRIVFHFEFFCGAS
jgi:RNA polymerase sigma-70 factor (ECF subfamily)